MLSINTNLSSLIAQNSMKTSTDKLNQAIERMSTGFKINHAKDNAANYSISTNMSTKINAYQVAEDNTAMGLDLVKTASDIINQMETHASRLRALSVQASNGTYGGQSINAIQSEANALMSEITRLYMSSEYNGISLFNQTAASPAIALAAAVDLPVVGENGFIDQSTPIDLEPKYDGFIVNPKTYDDATVNAMTSIDSFTSGASGNFKIEDAEDLAKLATLVNGGANTENASFFLANDIDLADWCATHGNWVPIGYDYDHKFKGIFDGNGHVIKNLKIDNPTADSQGLFGNTDGATIKNVGMEDCVINAGRFVGVLLGGNPDTSPTVYIENCYATGNVTGNDDVGGLVGLSFSGSSIKNSYSTINVTGNDYVGGLTGEAYSTITNSYATGSVTGNNSVGGFAGVAYGSITNSYATGSVTGNNKVGGLVGYGSPSSITNSYATGNVEGSEFVGGLAGQFYKTSGTTSISSSYSSGEVTGTDKTGSFIGGVVNTYNGISFGTINISDCYSLDNGMDMIGGCYKYSSSTYTSNTNGYDAMVGGISVVDKSVLTPPSPTPPATGGGVGNGINLQIGVHGNENSRLSFNTSFMYDLSELELDISSANSLNSIDEFIKTLSSKQTELGAVTNRLESALDEISIQYENLVSSRSTLRDADIAEVSSHYIQQQILQQASATLMATANQSPSIALQLI